jgi:uncharacterized membrane protein YidH (DUF202 family)
MDAEWLKTVGQIAGIGGLALGVFLILFREVIRKSIFPTLKKDDAYRFLRLVVILVWSIGVVGIGAWVWTETHAQNAVSQTTSGPNSPAVQGVKSDVNIITGGKENKGQ